jgi:plasmid stabilization system protein ParE
MLPVGWLPEAEADLKEAHAWYKDIRTELGDRFELAVASTIDTIAKNPLQFPIVYRGRRRAGIPRFPYGMFFEVQEDRIVIIACFHGRRDPKHWQMRPRDPSVDQ